MENIIDDLLDISSKAGEKILEIYNSFDDMEIEYKKDDSPITKADREAHRIISEGLKKVSDYPILSEEGKDIPYEKRKNWEYFWLVDPLDGTKEFIKRNGEFTVNIALIHKNKPVLGVVYAPAKDIFYYGGKKIGSFKKEKGKTFELPIEKEEKDFLSLVVTKSHMNEETKAFLEKLEKKFKNLKTVSIGSSLKICLVAEGKADIYPRIGPTMEWDTAAAHAVLNGAGGKIVQFQNTDIENIKNLPELTYNKENLLNPYFIAFRKDVF
ncbi:MAG: 3'(2'),5'-bisphosphate nucleotidase CysQ [Aquificae bacterium]|nr:3'(2'),5'-bisphosphate nucleotidase CysQ [Aquificota bacterium]